MGVDAEPNRTVHGLVDAQDCGRFFLLAADDIVGKIWSYLLSTSNARDKGKGMPCEQ